MRKMLNEWRKFLEEDEWAFDPMGLKDAPRARPEQEDVWTKDEEAEQALLQIRIELGRDRLDPREERLLVIAAQEPGFWGELVMNLQGSENKEEFFNSVIEKLKGKHPPLPEGEENF